MGAGVRRHKVDFVARRAAEKLHIQGCGEIGGDGIIVRDLTGWLLE